MSDYIFERNGRRASTAVTVVVIWALLALAMVFLDASVWVVWLGALATLPALYDLAVARVSSLRLDVVPPSRAFEDALKQRGIPVERHHFRLIG